MGLSCSLVFAQAAENVVRLWIFGKRSDTDTTWRIAKGYELFLFVIPTCPRPNVLLKMGVNVATNKRGCSSS